MKISAKLYKIWKYLKKGQVIITRNKLLEKALILCTKREDYSANFGDLKAWVKIHQILVIFEITNRFCFFFKFCIALQYHETQILCTFLTETLWIFKKRSLSKYKFVEIWWTAESLKFCTLMGSCSKKHKILAKKV